MRNVILPVLLAAGLALAGCNVIKNAPVSTVETNKLQPKPNPKPRDNAKLVNPIPENLPGEWAIVNVAGADIAPQGDVLPSLTLTPNPELNGVLDVIGYNGCNYLNGGWQVGGNSLKAVGEFISTLRACPDAPHQQSINQALERTRSFAVEGDKLILRDAAGQEVMRLRNHTLAFINGAWRVASIAGMELAPTIDIRVVLDADEGRIHGNAGCNTLNGKLISTLERKNGVEFRDLRTTRMTCPDIATEQSFLLALEEAVSVRADGDGRIAFDNDQGQPIITMTKADPEP